MTPIYLDNMATTALDPRAFAAMRDAWERGPANPASATHRYGWEAADAVELAREQVADLMCAGRASTITFTSGATESNNWVLKSTLGDAGGGRLVVSAVEHPSVLVVGEHLRRLGVEVVAVTADAGCVVSAEAIEAALTRDTRLVSVMAANNETGTTQGIRRIAEVAHAQDVPVHVDATQMVGKLPFDVRALGVDFASISAHKLYGPMGVGALYMREGQSLTPLIHGGGQERGLRGGTSAVPQIVGFGTAATLALAERGAEAGRLGLLSARLLDALTAELGDVQLNGDPNRRLPGCLNLSIGGVNNSALINATPEVAFSAGSACTSGRGGGSHVLKAMGLPPERRRNAIRLGLGRFTTAEDVERAAEFLVRSVARLRQAGGRPG